MAAVKAAEVSAILKKQLSGFEATDSLDEVGTVLQVGDGIARVSELAGIVHQFHNDLDHPFAIGSGQGELGRQLYPDIDRGVVLALTRLHTTERQIKTF